MDETAADGAGARVQILVAAPNGEVGAGVVDRERHVADRMGEIEADAAAVPLRRRSVRGEVEPLARQILHAGQQNERDALALFREQRLVPLTVELEAARARPDLEQGRARIEPVPAQLRFHGVAIRREDVALDEDFVALRRGSEERREHQVQVHGQRVHRDDLVALRADELRKRRRELHVIVEPAAVRGPERARAAARRPRIREVTVDAQRRPTVQLGLNDAAGRSRHEAERVPAQVGKCPPVLARQLELAAQRSELVGRVERARAGEPRQELQFGHGYFGGTTVPQRLQVRASTLP